MMSCFRDRRGDGRAGRSRYWARLLEQATRLAAEISAGSDHISAPELADRIMNVIPRSRSSTCVRRAITSNCTSQARSTRPWRRWRVAAQA